MKGDRLAHLAETEGGTGKVRLLIWEGVVRLLGSRQPLWSPASGEDGLHRLRPLVGYGPDTMRDAFMTFAPPALAHLDGRPVDRAHNAVLDALVHTGGLGLLASLALLTSVVTCGLTALGMVTRPSRPAILALWLGGGVVGGLASDLADGSWRMVGVAVSAGMLFGFVVYVVWVARGRGSHPDPPATPDRLIASGLLAGVLAHFVETQFGLATIATETAFWVFAAALAAIVQRAGVPGWSDGEREPTPAPPRHLAVRVLLVGFALATAVRAWRPRADHPQEPGLGQNLRDFHSAFRVDTRRVLETIPFGTNSDDFVFDSEFLAQLVHFRFRIGDAPVPARYFAEASSMNFWRTVVYGLGMLRVLGVYLAHRAGQARPLAPVLAAVTARRDLSAVVLLLGVVFTCPLVTYFATWPPRMIA